MACNHTTAMWYNDNVDSRGGDDDVKNSLGWGIDGKKFMSMGWR